MAHFYGSMQGSRGETTRCGTRNSGLYAHVRGWDIGCEALIEQDCFEVDSISIRITGGSNSKFRGFDLGTFTRDELEMLLDGRMEIRIVGPGIESGEEMSDEG